MKTLEEIRAAGARFQMHLNLGDSYAYHYCCIAEPRLFIALGGPKGRKSKAKPYRIFAVADDPAEYLSLEDAYNALKARDDADNRAIQDELEWELAAPRPVRYICSASSFRRFSHNQNRG